MRVLGYQYGEGMKKLRILGMYPHMIRVVKPPGAKIGKGRLMIIAEREEKSGIELLLSYEDYDR